MNWLISGGTQIPNYVWRCGACGRPYEGYRKVDERHESPVCCGKQTQLVIMATMVRPDIHAYQSPIDGRAIESRKQRSEDFKRNGCRPWEGLDAEKQNAAQQTKYIEEKKEARLDKDAHEAYYELSPSKRDALKWLTERS